MATHYICHSTEPLPHRYPSTGPDKKDHGAVSRYEVLNMAPKSHTQFSSSDWSWSQTSEDDSLPLCQPAPVTKCTETVPVSVPGPDPELCVTPIKTLTGVRHDNPPAHPSLSDPDLSLTFDNRDEVESGDPDVLPNVIPVSLEDNEIPSLDQDPDLSLTPDHFAKSKSYIDNSRRGESTLKGKVRHRVRFDLQDDDPQCSKRDPGVVVFKHYEADTSGETSVADGNSEPLTYPKTIQYNVKCISDKKTAGLQNIDVGVDNTEMIFPKQSKPNGEFGLPKRKVVVKREAPVKPVLKEYSILENNDASESEHVFNRPEFHSTLRMTSEIKQLKESVIDVEKAVKKKLQQTDKASEQISEKASLKTNRESTTFSDLISLDVPVQQLCDQAQWKQTSKVQKSSKTKQTSTCIAGKEPDLLEFFTRDVQREVADFSQNSISAPSSSLCIAKHSSAFDLYQHNQAWETI